MFDDVTYAHVDPQHIEGEMTVGTKQKSSTLGEPEFNTLDEPIRDTIVSVTVSHSNIFYTAVCFIILWYLLFLFLVQLRDVRAVGKKFFHVLYPKEKKSLLKECKSTNNTDILLKSELRVTLCIVFLGDLWGPLVLCTFMAM